MVIPRARSSGALSIWSYARKVAPPDFASTLVMAAVSVVLPWSTWPIVPMLTCGLLRSNFSLLISRLQAERFRGRSYQQAQWRQAPRVRAGQIGLSGFLLR